MWPSFTLHPFSGWQAYLKIGALECKSFFLAFCEVEILCRNKEWGSDLGHGAESRGLSYCFLRYSSFIHVCWGNGFGLPGRIFFVLNSGGFHEKFSAHCVTVQVEHKQRTLQTTHTNLCSHLRQIIRTWNVCHQSQTFHPQLQLVSMSLTVVQVR